MNLYNPSKFKYHFFFTVFLLFFCQSPIWSFNPELEKSLYDTLKFTNKQVTAVKNIFDSSVKKGLPEKVLILRIKEAIAKKVTYDNFYKVFIAKIEKLEYASQLVGDTNTDRSYYVQLIAEFMDRGLAEEDFNEISAVASIVNKKFEDVLVYIQTYILLLENGISESLAKEIIIYSMKMRSVEVKLIPDLFKKAKVRNIPTKKVRDIFIEGIDKKKDYLSIYRKLFGIEPEEIRSEIKEEIYRDHERENKR